MSKMFRFIKDAEKLGTKDKTIELEAFVTYNSNRDGDTMQELFRLMLCPSIVYNIKKIPETLLDIEPKIDTDLDLVMNIRELIRRDLRGNALKDEVGLMVARCTREIKEVLKWVLARKNPAKISKSVVNKVWPNVIRTQRYMGAVPGTQKALEALPWDTGVIVEDKEDGMAVLIDYKNGVPVAIRSRQGVPMDKYFPAFKGALKYIPGFNGMLHHELFCGDLDRKAGNALITAQVKKGVVGGTVDNSLHSVILNLVDDNNPGTTQEDRFWIMNYFTTPRSRRVNSLTCYSLQDARKVAKRRIQAGGEGVVCKDPRAPFKDGKPTSSVKIKNEFEVTLICRKVNPHDKHPNLVGSLEMTSYNGGLVVNVGSGLTDEIRDEPWENFIGLCIDVTANEVIQDKKKITRALYLPRFDRGDSTGLPVRFDKDKPDTLSQILAEEAMSKGL